MRFCAGQRVWCFCRRTIDFLVLQPRIDWFALHCQYAGRQKVVVCERTFARPTGDDKNDVGEFWDCDLHFGNNSTGLMQRNPKQRPRALGTRPRRYVVRHNSIGPTQLPPRSLRTPVFDWLTGLTPPDSGR